MEKEAKKQRPKYECIPLDKDDMTAILDMTITTMKNRGGRPFEYPQTEQGLATFRENTIAFFDYVKQVNQNPDLERKLIPDIEAWATYLGITRTTIFNYEKRGGEWAQTIQTFKNAMASIKKQLLFNYKIPPMVGVFDLTNNHGYVNSNEFKLTQTLEVNTHKNDLEKAIDEYGLEWDSVKEEFRPRGGQEDIC